MSDTTIAAGVTSTGLTVTSGDNVYDYGSSVDFSVTSGGLEFVYSGGTAISTTATGSGVSGAGGEVIVSSGGTTSFTTVSNGGFESLSGGGASAISTTVGSDGYIRVFDGGTLLGTTVNSGGSDYVYSGVASNTTLNGAGTFEYVGGGSAVNTTVNSGATQELYNSGVAIPTTVNSGGTQVIYAGGSAVSATISGGGFQNVSAGGIAIDTQVSSDSTGQGLETVGNGGITSDTSTTGGGWEIVSAGGSAVATDVVDNGNLFLSSGGVSLNADIDNGEELVSAGGLASGTTVGSDGVVYDQGGTTVGTVISNGGYQVTESPNADGIPVGSSVDTQVNDGGNELVSVGGVTTGTTVSSGGTEQVLSGGVVSSSIIYAGGTELVEGGYGVAGGGSAVGATISGGTQIIGSGGSATSTTVSSGGFETISSGGTAAYTTVSNGGVEVISSGGTASNTVLSSGGSIDVTYLNYTSGGTVSVNSSTDVLTISADGQVYTQQLSGDYAGEFFHLTSDTGNGTLLLVNDTPPCYGHGTRFLTDHGEVAVEQLAIGDHVHTASGSVRPIRWIGYRHLDLRRHPSPEQVQPILIRANAVADGVPSRDLRVSPDHAVLLDDMLIPARLLINGASIQRETQCQTITYYHVELETHDILLAEAMPAESYLDTGNRGIFENAVAPIVLHPNFDDGQRRREAGSCRPFVDDAASLEPIWHRLAMRSTLLGLDLPARTAATRDPGLHMVVDGRTIMPVSSNAGRYTFVLPATGGPVRLVSRSARPCDARPWVEDRRHLGVMVSRLTLTRGPDIAFVPLDDPRLSRGWWDIEREGSRLVRWTDGNSAIPLSLTEPVILDIVVGGDLDYPLDQDTGDKAAEAVAA